MTKVYPLLLLLLCQINLFGQFDQISVGQSYTDQVFYSLSEGSLSSANHEVWDIAFTTQGIRDAGIFINEGTSLGQINQIELYNPSITDFDTNISQDSASWTRLYNPETDWENGAFNTIKDENNPIDYGWGIYNHVILTVEGVNVYVIRLRSGQWKKIFIESLLFDWNFRYADLDGSNEVNVTIKKEDHTDNILAYYSMENHDVVNIEPRNWDLLFTRYNTYTDDGNGNFLDYVVTGVLSGFNVQVAEFDNVDPDDLDDDDVDPSRYESELDVIGFDWKSVDINSSVFSVDDDRVFFVKKADQTICKVQFIDFEGASTGVITIEKDCYIVASQKEIAIEGLKSLHVFPNPTTDFVNILTDFSKDTEAIISLIDINGRVIQKDKVIFNAGFQHKNQRINNSVTGKYYLTIQAEGKIETLPLFVKN